MTILVLLERAGMAIAQISVFLMMLIITSDGLGRYLFSTPLTGQVEVTSLYLMVMLTFLALPRVYTLGGHVRIEFVLDMMPTTLRRIAGRSSAAIAAAAFLGLTVFSAEVAIDKIAVRESSFGIIQFPLYLSYVWVPIGSSVMLARLMAEAILPRDWLDDTSRAPTKAQE